MAHRYSVPITVEWAPDSVPVAFTWREERHTVKVIGTWRLATGRWDVAKRVDRTYFRVEAADRQVFELYYDGVCREWMLDVVQD